jgi:voltage-gated potassium channel
MTLSLKLTLYHALFGKEPGDRLRLILEVLITGLVIASLIAIILESVPALHDDYHPEFYAFEVIAIAFFTVEYLVRIWCCTEGSPGLPAWRARMRYVFSFYGLIDLLAMLPFYLHPLFPEADLRFLRVVRMLRVLKLSHYNTALEDLFTAVMDERKSFLSAVYILSIATLVTSCLAYYAEHEAQPDKFGSIPDAMWWAVITLTTVGYGDAAPVTFLGKVIGIMTALLGVCTVALLTGIVANSFANQMARKRAIFEAELAKALRDGEISEDEQRVIERLRQSFNLTREHANAITERLRQERSGP